MLGPGATPLDLRFTGPDGTEHASAHLILVSNDPCFRLQSGQPVEIGIDGEALVLDPPIEFRTLPGGPRRLSRRPGYQEARMRAWPPEPSSYGMSPTTIVAPLLGMRSRLARFSSP
jgi:hypothetical protein